MSRVISLGGVSISFNLWVKFSADDILKFFFFFYLFFPPRIRFGISCKLSPIKVICMKYQILFSGKNKKTITSFSSAEFAPRLVKAKCFACCIIKAKVNSLGSYINLVKNLTSGTCT